MQFLLLYAIVAALVAAVVWRDRRPGESVSTALGIGALWLPVVAMLLASGLIQGANWLWVEHVYPALFGRWRS